MEPKIAIIIVLFQTPEKEIQRLKKEIDALKFKNYQIYLIDNTGKNLGYGRGLNLGIKKALKDGCQLFICANSDISLKKLTGQIILNGFDKYHLWGLPMRQNNKIYYGGLLDRWHMSGYLVTRKRKTIDFISGSLMVIKKEVFDKIGFFDENYFLYYEDVDFCWRAKKAGYKLGILEKPAYEHFENSKNNPQKRNLLEKSRKKFLFKYGNFWQKIYDFFT
ncbi:MAG: glycosyltransferase family 2 protein [Microgenomates group bacterium]|nr:glycosyltransferase family 2 protein [Microgenomates group bacterium]